VQISRECTLPYLSTGISNLLQPAQAEVVLGQRSTYLASWVSTLWPYAEEENRTLVGGLREHRRKKMEGRMEFFFMSRDGKLVHLENGGSCQ
jgi:hypothetical protein